MVEVHSVKTTLIRKIRSGGRKTPVLVQHDCLWVRREVPSPDDSRKVVRTRHLEDSHTVELTPVVIYELLKMT